MNVHTDPVWCLDALVQEIAKSSPDILRLLRSCNRCRNNLLYVMDTLPFNMGADTILAARLRAVPTHHESFHGGTDYDSGEPHISWIMLW